MEKIILIAGNKTESLQKFFNKHNGIKVEHAYPTLEYIEKHIEREIIRGDRLVYVYTTKTNTFGEDLGRLRNILGYLTNNKGLLYIDRLEFFYLDEPSMNDDLVMFNKIMSLSGFRNFVIHPLNARPSYTDLYNALLGVSKLSNSKGKSEGVYRVTRGTDVNAVMMPEDGGVEDSIEPFDNNHLRKYIDIKRNIKATDNGVLYRESSDTSIQLPQYDNPTLPRLDVKSFLNEKVLFVYSGNSKTGVSTNVALFIKSAIKEEKTVTLVNLTPNNDTSKYLMMLNVKGKQYSTKMTLLEPHIGTKEPMSIVNLYDDDDEMDIRLEKLDVIINAMDKIQSDVVVIECECSLLSGVMNTVGTIAHTLVFSVETLKKEVDKVSNMLNYLADDTRTIVILSNILKTINLTPSNVVERESYGSIKKRLRKDLIVLEPITEKDIGDNMYKRIITA